MAIRFTCSCGLTLEAEDQYAGQPTVCPQCGKQRKIPNPAAKLAVAKLLPPPAEPAPPPEPGFTVIEDEPAGPATKPKPRPSLTMRGEELARRKRKLKNNSGRRQNPTTKRVWKILGGIGLVVLGIAVLAAWWFAEKGRPSRLVVWGLVAVFVGLGGIGAGVLGKVDSDSGSDYDSDDD
ncbi:MAG TPA: hypothetical protein VGJ05_09085 [Fimbriiglobus sp.]|jgi:hypothetical protein